MNKNDLRVRRTRLSLENSLLELLKKKELSKILVSELSEKAMISRQTFYKHYISIEDLYIQTVANHFNRLNEQIINEINLTNSVTLKERGEILCKKYFVDVDALTTIVSVKRRELIIQGLKEAIKRWVDTLLPDWKFVDQDFELEMMAGAVLTFHTKIVKDKLDPNIEEFIQLNHNFVNMYSTIMI